MYYYVTITKLISVSTMTSWQSSANWVIRHIKAKYRIRQVGPDIVTNPLPLEIKHQLRSNRRQK
jgi:hypothetical protein